MDYKARPVLVIGQADNSDYVVLPISRVLRSENIDSYFDVPMEITDFPLMNLKAKSYIRTHKQTCVHASSIKQEITDFRSNYNVVYREVMNKVREFQKALIESAV